ncbi:MAG: peptide chain release factor N(5)-glutamine methyltransferase [Leptolyngbyaceae cyanobacterium bins.349]|nr:peptide chain release factor N(5)-glutamine methyltransferase [Leptolyngbyaceae cyanobacterium bins.349]
MTQFQADDDQLLSSDGGQEFVISGMALWEWWQWARQTAIAHHIPPQEADWLLQAFTHLDRLELRLGSFQHREHLLLKVPPHRLQELWEQRTQQRVPVQYLVGKTTWRDFSLQVSPAVLIPRPETELLIDFAVELTNQRSDEPEREGLPTPGHWADLGTGSGAIALGLAQAFPQARIHAVDVSAAALAIAQTNAAAHQFSDRIHFYQGHWLEPLHPLRGQLHGIIANPPYIPSSQVLTLQPEVTQHEPHLALDGGVDGLDCIRHLVAAAPAYLQPGGIWMIEMMAGQAVTVAQLLNQNGHYDNIQIRADLAGIERFAIARRISG